MKLKILEIKKEIDKAIETYKKLAKDGKSSNK